MQTLTGKVIHGDQVGRTLGFPTANLDVKLTEAELEPGVYLAKCDLSLNPNLPPELQGEWDCLPYFGPRLIFGEVVNSFEVYMYNFDHQIYDLTLRVSLGPKLRGPLPFTTLDALTAQLVQDKNTGLALLAQANPVQPKL